MATTSVSDAVVFPQDDGTGVPAGSESYDSAGSFGALARNTGAEYKEGATLSNLDTTNETVDVAAGVVYVREGGNTVQSGAQNSYDTTLPEDMVYAVALPTSTTVSLDTDTSADLRLVVDPTSQDTVTIEHNTSPTNPSLVIGTVDSSSGGTASGRNAGPIVNAEEINLDRVKDSGGRYHGQLTGTNDAQVVIDAIADRKGDASIILPDPGFDLDWEQEVELPREESFSLDTVGVPTLDIPSGFTGSAALVIPDGTANTDYSEINSFRVADTNKVLSELMRLVGAANITVNNPQSSVGARQGIRVIDGVNGGAHSVDIYNPVIKTFTDNSSCVRMEVNNGGFVNDCRVWGPYFTSGPTPTGNVAFYDSGNENVWENCYVEHCNDGIPFVADGANGYKFTTNDLDRVGGFNTVVEERGSAHGLVELSTTKLETFHKLRLQAPNTDLIMRGGFQGFGQDHIGTVDQMEGVHMATQAELNNSPPHPKLRDNSSGGSVSAGVAGAGGTTNFNLGTGATSGNTAVLDQGGVSVRSDYFPKFATRSLEVFDTTQVIVKCGFYNPTSPTPEANRAEFIFDPTNSGRLDHPNDTWYWDVEIGGTAQDTTPVDTGIAGGFNQHVAINREPDQWSAIFDSTLQDVTALGGSSLDTIQWRLSVETTENADKHVHLRIEDGLRLLVQ
jgi:hypothetical protein